MSLELHFAKERIRELEIVLASRNKEIEKLRLGSKAASAASKDKGIPNSGTNPGDDSSVNGSDDSENDSDADLETDPGRVFPDEIMDMIAGYLEPGSRTLLHLASSCMALYNLLLPLVWRKVALEPLLEKSSRFVSKLGEAKSVARSTVVTCQSVGARSNFWTCDLLIRIPLICRKSFLRILPQLRNSSLTAHEQTAACFLISYFMATGIQACES